MAKIKIIFVWKFDQISDFHTNMKKVVVASDSFKDCLSSMQVADAVEKGIHEVYPECEVVKLGVADGGEGTLDVFRRTYGGTEITMTVEGPLVDQVEATYLILHDGKTAVIEMASVCGLTLVPSDRRDPIKSTTYGLGQLIMDAIVRGCRKVIVTLGGSATVDAGLGMLSAMGFRFYNDGYWQGGRMPNACYAAELELLRDYDDAQVPREVRDTEFVAVCDVNAPLCGPDGAALRYGPQKGMDRYMAEAIECGMRNFAGIVKDKTGISLHEMPAAGAAGGVAGAMIAFLGAQVRQGSDAVLDAVCFEEHIKGADLIITGEGRIDCQTMDGKLPYAVACRAECVPVVAVCGSSEVASLPCFSSIISVTPPGMPLNHALNPMTASKNITTATVNFLKKKK